MIIVTGGAGFIGSNIVKELNRRGRRDILIVDDLKDGLNYKNLRGLQFVDYQHKDDFLQSTENDDFDGTDIDAVFHEGACSDTMEYDVNFMMRTNYEYSKSLLHFCLRHRIPFMYASSASTYGSGKHGFREGDECEDALNPYAFQNSLLTAMCGRLCRKLTARWWGSSILMFMDSKSIIKGKWHPSSISFTTKSMRQAKRICFAAGEIFMERR